MRTYDKLYIDGTWVPADGTGRLEVVNSTTEEVMATIPEGTATDVDLPAVAFQAKSITTQFQAIKVFVNNFVVSGDPSAATSSTSRLSFLENGFKNIPATHEKIEPVVKQQ